MRKMILIIIFGLVFSLPRFSVEQGASCMSCHINPTGSGMRNDYGSNIYALEELPLQNLVSKGSEDWDGFINDNIQLGGEFRIQYFDGNVVNAIFPMQADIYGNIDINNQVDLYFEIPIGGSSQNSEYYMIVKEYIDNAWIKMGKSDPNYGLMVDDHTAFIKSGNRDPIDNGETDNLDKGLRKVFDPYSKPIIIETGINLSDNLVLTSSISESEINVSQMENFTASLNYINTFNNVSLMIGNSLMLEDDIELYGLFGGLSRGSFTFMFELDNANNLLSDNTESVASYSQIVYKPIQGLHILAKYDYFDHNYDLLNGSLSRYSVGIELYPLNLFEVKLQLREYKVDNLDLNFNQEYLLQLHSWF